METFNEYLKRVSRARHLLMTCACQADFARGVAVGYRNAAEYLPEHGSASAPRESFAIMEGFCKRLSLKGITTGLVAQDRVLTYREDELYGR